MSKMLNIAYYAAFAALGREGSYEQELTCSKKRRVVCT